MKNGYVAEDDDLPEEMFGKANPDKIEVLPTREQLCELIYAVPEYHEKNKVVELRERKIATAQRKEMESDRKVFIHSRKTAQMNIWLLALKNQNPKLNKWEEEFVNGLYNKFSKYYPHVKWITLKQFLVLKSIAESKLKVFNQ